MQVGLFFFFFFLLFLFGFRGWQGEGSGLIGGWVVQLFLFCPFFPPPLFLSVFFPFSPTPYLLFCFKARAGAGRVGKNCAGGLGLEVRSEVY